MNRLWNGIRTTAMGSLRFSWWLLVLLGSGLLFVLRAIPPRFRRVLLFLVIATAVFLYLYYNYGRGIGWPASRPTVSPPVTGKVDCEKPQPCSTETRQASKPKPKPQPDKVRPDSRPRVRAYVEVPRVQYGPYPGQEQDVGWYRWAAYSRENREECRDNGPCQHAMWRLNQYGCLAPDYRLLPKCGG